MRILVCFYRLIDRGGIINTTEGLIAGLKYLGHTVRIVELQWKAEAKDYHGQDRASTRMAEESALGGKVDQDYGWYHMPRFAYKGDENLRRWKEYAGRFDLIIWNIPVPSKVKHNIGNLDWIELYNIPVKQIAYIHDGNMSKTYPHLYAIVDKLCGVTGTHPCAYNSLKDLPVPRAMALCPQMNIKGRLNDAAIHLDKDRSGFLNLQTWKLWKHPDDIVRAIPHMGSEYRKRMAGGGYLLDYMRSKNKLKLEFITNRTSDPDCRRRYIGKPIWDVAEEHGLRYYKYISNAKREKLLHKSRVLIDPSWSKRYASIGDHINRVAMDSFLGGCALVARNLGVGMDISGTGEIMKPGENYLMIPYDATPKEFARLVDHYVSDDSKKLRARILEAGRELVKRFDYRKTAQVFIDLALGKEFPKGEFNQRIAADGKWLVERHFSGRRTPKGFLTK